MGTTVREPVMGATVRELVGGTVADRDRFPWVRDNVTQAGTVRVESRRPGLKTTGSSRSRMEPGEVLESVNVVGFLERVESVKKFQTVEVGRGETRVAGKRQSLNL